MADIWTIKGIPPEDRSAATAAAARNQQTIGEWMRRAIRTQIQADRIGGRLPMVVTPAPAASSAQPNPSTTPSLTELVEVATRLEDKGLDPGLRRAFKTAIRKRLADS